MQRAATKKQLLRALDEAAYALGKTVESSSDIQDVTAGLPDAFPVVARHLPVLVRSLGVIEKRLKATADGQETPEMKEKYGAAILLAEGCRKQAGYLQDLFTAVTPVNANETVGIRMERYREAVADANGDRLESVLRDLLERAVDLAPTLVGDDVLVGELQEALTEVANLKPSLKESPKGAVTLNNYGPGQQFLHNGKGNQNLCSGGVQITGDGATNHIGSGYTAS